MVDLCIMYLIKEIIRKYGYPFQILTITQTFFFIITIEKNIHQIKKILVESNMHLWLI